MRGVLGRLFTLPRIVLPPPPPRATKLVLVGVPSAAAPTLGAVWGQIGTVLLRFTSPGLEPAQREVRRVYAQRQDHVSVPCSGDASHRGAFAAKP